MSEDELPIQANTVKISTLVDGSLRAVIEIHERDKQRYMNHFGEPNEVMAIVKLRDFQHQDKPDHPDHGQYANKLHRVGFFQNPLICLLAGSDEEFLSWTRKQFCCICDHLDVDRDTGIEQNEAAHVRRVGLGSGTGIKPAYSAVPLCHDCHHKQHNKGESELLEGAGWEKLRAKYLTSWCKSALKKQLGAESFREIGMEDLVRLAEENDMKEIKRYIPLEE